jgi:DNA-binding NarL/FixJ family response regulator
VTRVFVVDDHAMVRAGVRVELGSDVDVVGEAADVDQAVQGIRSTRPDVVLLDVHLPGGRCVPSCPMSGGWRCRSPTPPRTSSR